ncbi:hypothetical protein [Robiginitalea sp. IMCC43444]|uniref:hypothetical protein n=1 Tax=Robiginitalea sp. IMCC43444 TaxID=3459121 RepID=UPI0040422BF1
MKKKRYEGALKEMQGFEIYLNINHLKQGNYELKIINKNKVIKRIHFKKNN